MHAPSQAPWWRQLSGYHWFVFLVASGAWFFDCLDQRLFSLARIPALNSLMAGASQQEIQAFGKVVTAWFLIGWGIGGMIFGALGDRFGRAKMLSLTILIYSACTGLSYFSHNALDFTIFRFLTGLGVGGVFGLAVSLIAETVPAGARVQALGLLQVLSTVGNLSAGFAFKGISALETAGTIMPNTTWRWMFLIGAIPALLVIVTHKYLREPESWLRLKEAGQLPKGNILSSYSVLFSDKRWRKNLVVGALIASTGVVGLWAIGEYAVDLQSTVFKTHYEKEAPAEILTLVQEKRLAYKQLAAAPEAVRLAAAAELKAAEAPLNAFTKPKVDNAKFWAYIWNMLGGAAGMWVFTYFARAAGRRIAFLVGFSCALVVTVLVYWKMNSPQDAYWMMPLMGAAQLGVFAGFAIYLPELFPSRLRSTGTSFCYNLGRFAAAGGSFFSSALTTGVYGNFPGADSYRYSAMTMCAIFLVGIITLAFAPETKGQPLPEEDAL